MIALCGVGQVNAQKIPGRVLDRNGKPLFGAHVYWAIDAKDPVNSVPVGVTTNVNGDFEIWVADSTRLQLIARYVGKIPDTLVIIDGAQLKSMQQAGIKFHLMDALATQEISVEADRRGVVILDLMPAKTEQINAIELKKAACCDLSGCFETQTSVQPQVTNVVTQAKELRLLGLSGVYNQILIDGFPMIHGLTYTYGISSIPGPLVENIFVAKGANSVLQGFESISGQINVETKDPSDCDPLLLNLYINSFGERQINSLQAFNRKKWKASVAGHWVEPALRIDRDDDQFLDIPLIRRFSIFNRWSIGNEKEVGWHSRIGIRAFHERRLGGQIEFDPKKDLGGTRWYGQLANLTQPELWTKSGYRFHADQQIVLMASTFWHRQVSHFGTVHYQAQQLNTYANLQYEHRYGENEIKTGVSFRYYGIEENIQILDTIIDRNYDGRYDRIERIAGAFAENTLRWHNNTMTLLTGLRADHHQKHGAVLTPRILFRYEAWPGTILRINAGSGWRTANPWSEYQNMMSSSRHIVMQNDLEPERAFNTGLNITHKYVIPQTNWNGFLTAEYYYTEFFNQIFPDYLTNSAQIVVQNNRHPSFSNTLQAEATLNASSVWEWKLGYVYLDVYRMESGLKQELPFNPRNRILGTMSHRPKRLPIQVDINVHHYGPQRMPETRDLPEELQRPDFSQPFQVINAQLSYRSKRWEVYVGCENVADFRQIRPIIGWQQPFGRFFDTSSVWGPTRGREFYLGMRYDIKRNISG